MAVDSIDPIDGHPIFLDQGAPDIGVDPTAVAEYAALVGTRAVGTTAQMDAWPYRREQFAWGNTTDGNEYIIKDGDWVPQVGGGAVPTLSFSSGWADLDGNTRVQRVGKLVVANLIFKKNAGIVTLESPVTFPVGFRPAKTVGGSGFISGANAPMHIGFQIESSGVLRVYFAGTATENLLAISVTYMAV